MLRIRGRSMQCQMGKSHAIQVKIGKINKTLFGFFSVSASKSPGGKHVTITVRETKTERMTPVNQSYPGKIPSKKRQAMTFI